MTSNSLYEVRPVKEEDKNFILATFLRGLYYGNPWFTEIPKDIFMSNYKKVAEELVNGSRTSIQIACLPDDPDVIVGYSILSADYQTIVWVFVKKNFRGHGIGRTLVPKYPKAVNQLTELGKTLLNKFDPKPIFDPFTL